MRTRRSRRAVALSLLACSVVLAWPSAAGAVVDLTAVETRIADHPAFVRVVVDFADGTLVRNEVQTTDPSPFDGTVRVRVDHLRVQAQAPRTVGLGIRVRVVQGTNRIGARIRSVQRRFKYVSYTVVGADRLAIDLWKSAPPSPAAEVHRGRAGCLTLDPPSIVPGRVIATGAERNLFEHGLLAVVRGPGGSVLGQRPVIAAARRWQATVDYRASRQVVGTVEAIAASAKDGSLDCLVQRRVVLPAAP
jgi:hypothetical protein